jgi:hypothetical protein
MNLRNISRGLAALGAVAAGMGILVAPRADAAYVVKMQQVYGDVVATGSGSIDLAALTAGDLAFENSFVDAFAGELFLGPVPTGAGYFTEHFVIYGPTAFGPGNLFLPNTGDGQPIAIQLSSLFVPSDYVSGSPGSSTDTWNSMTLADLGVTAGTYVWKWGVGVHADSFTLYAGVTPPGTLVPEPASLTLLSAALAALGLCRLRVSKRGNAPTGG